MGSVRAAFADRKCRSSDCYHESVLPDALHRMHISYNRSIGPQWPYGHTRLRDRVVVAFSKSGCLCVKSLERKNTCRAQVVQCAAISEQPDSLSGGVDDVFSPKFPQRRGIARIAIPLDGSPIFPERGCLPGVTHAD